MIEGLAEICFGDRIYFLYVFCFVVYVDSIHIFINILPKTHSQRDELKAYFLRKLGKNIDEYSIKFLYFLIKSRAFGQIYPRPTCTPALLSFEYWQSTMDMA